MNMMNLKEDWVTKINHILTLIIYNDIVLSKA